MARSKIQQIFDHSWEEYLQTFPASSEQVHAGYSIIHCKTKEMGYNVSTCSECGYKQIHNNSCRKRNCPNCQAFLKEIWIDARKSEVIDTPSAVKEYRFSFLIAHGLDDTVGVGVRRNLLGVTLHFDALASCKCRDERGQYHYLLHVDSLFITG